MTTTVEVTDSRRETIRRLFAADGGACSIGTLAQRVLRSGVLRDEERDFAVLRWLKEECRKALTEEDGTTGLPFAGESAQAAPGGLEDGGRPVRVFKQLDLWDFDDFAHNVGMKTQSIASDRQRLHRLIRWGQDRFGRAPRLPPWLGLDDEAR